MVGPDAARAAAEKPGVADSMRRFLSELKRRKVYHVGAVYALVAFGVWQVADIAFPGLGLPDSAVTLVLILTILGFPIALVLAWAYEVRPEAPPVGQGEHDAAEGVGDPGGTREDRRPPEDPSLVVLPFENLDRESDGGYFADGVTEEITHTLATSSNIRVVARTSAFALREAASDVREVASRLGVSHVLEGSVRRAGERLRITVQLIDATDGYHVWSERYDRDVGDVFAIQDEIARRVAAQLAGTLPANVTVRMARTPAGRRDAPTTDGAAYEAYLRGLQKRARFDPRSLAGAAAEFAEAVERDPEFAPAQAALAEILSTQAIGLGVTSHDVMPRARAAAERALRLDPELPEAHVARSLVSMFYERDYPAAKRGFDRALALNPSHADAYMWSEFYWTYIAGVYESAVAATLRAQELNPLEPSVRVRLASVHYIYERYDEALAVLERESAASSDLPMLRVAMADVMLRTGRIGAAVTHANRALDLAGGTADGPTAILGVAGGFRAFAGDREGGRLVLRELEKRAGAGVITSFWQATVHAALGDLDGAFRLLDQGFDEHDCSLHYVMAVPRQFGFRTDPRMPAFLERMRLSHLLPAAGE